MDKKYIDALLDVILKTDMSDINPRSVEIIPVSYAPDGTRSEDISLICSFRQPETISNAWVAGNILIFTAFDGYLESKYGLKEGDSFKKHYTNLPATSDLEKIEKNRLNHKFCVMAHS